MKIKLGLGRMSVQEKIAFGDVVALKLTGNPNFPAPAPSAAEIAAATNALRAASKDYDATSLLLNQKLTVRVNAETALDKVLGQSAMNVDSTSGGDVAKIESAGYSIKAAPTPVGPLPAPTHLSATTGDMEGECDLVWNPVRGAATYAVQVGDGGAGPWTAVASPTPTKSKATIGGFASGARRWFRVAAIGSAGQGPWSDPATANAG